MSEFEKFVTNESLNKRMSELEQSLNKQITLLIQKQVNAVGNNLVTNESLNQRMSEFEKFVTNESLNQRMSELEQSLNKQISNLKEMVDLQNIFYSQQKNTEKARKNLFLRDGKWAPILKGKNP